MAEISLDDDVMDEAAMAEAMGFSGFGMQRPPSKKRKFNPNADAAVSAVSNDGKPASTGANTAPLGQRLRLPPPSSDLPARPPTTAAPVAGKTDTDEIGLDDDDDDDEGQAGSLARPGAAGGGDVNEDDPGSRYVDTSRPSRGYLPEELAEIEAQDKIDAILAGSIPGLPARPPAVAGSEGFGGYQDGQRNNQRGRGNNRHAPAKRHHPHHQTGDDSGPPWWEGYYDPKVNQNPWEALEKKMGLHPRGTWLPRNTKPVDPETGIQEDTHATTVDEEDDVGKGHTDEPL